MKKFNKLIKSMLAICLACVMVFAVGCNSSSSSSGPSLNIKPKPTGSAATMTITKSSIAMTVGDIVTNSVVPVPFVEGSEVQWVSSDENVAKVTIPGNGTVCQIEAVNSGEATLTATYQDLTQYCYVSVDFDAQRIPYIVTPFEQGDTINIPLGSTYSFDNQVQYGSRVFSDGEFSYEVADSSIVSIEGGTVTALTRGITQVTITGSWRGLSNPTLSTTVNIRVIDDVVLKLEDYDSDIIEVYSTDSVDGYANQYQNTFAFRPIALVGQDTVNISSDNITIADQSILTYDNGYLVGNKFGTTFVTISYQANDMLIEKQYTVNVLRPEVDFQKTVNYFSAYTGTLRDETKEFKSMTLAEFIFGEGTSEELIDATYGEEVLKIENNKVLGISGINYDTFDAVVSVGTNEVVYNVNMVVYGMYIYEASDLDVFVRSSKSINLDCYVELARDIDAINYVARKHFFDDTTSPYLPTTSKKINEADGFMGVFDGKGHSIYNLTTGEYGLLLGTHGANIRNVAFIDANITAKGLLGNNVDFAKIENVYIKVNSMTGPSSSMVIAGNYVSGTHFKNVYVNTGDIVNEGGKVYGSFCSLVRDQSSSVVTDVHPTFENCIVISNLPLGFFSASATWANLSMAGNTYAEVDIRYSQANYAWEQFSTSIQNTINSEWATLNTSGENIPGGEVLDRVGRVLTTDGVRSYFSIEEFKADELGIFSFSTFSTDYWSMKDGAIVWGKLNLSAPKGHIFFNLGSLAGQAVEGLQEGNNPIAYETGSEILLPNISCYGYKFVGWKDYVTGDMITDKSGDQFVIKSYDGEALELVAVWEKDPGVATGPDIELK